MVRLAKRGGKLMVYVLVFVMSTLTLAAIVNHGHVILKVKVLRNFKTVMRCFSSCPFYTENPHCGVYKRCPIMFDWLLFDFHY